MRATAGNRAVEAPGLAGQIAARVVVVAATAAATIAGFLLIILALTVAGT